MIDFTERLRKRERIIGSFVIEMPVRGTIEAYATAGFDFLILDLEHSATDFERLSFLVACCRAEAIGCVVRIRAGGQADLTRVLDMHPDGVMVPGISNADEAEDVVRRSRFYPLGERGLAPLGRHHLENEDALAAIDSRTAVIVQVEGRTAVDNATAIASVEGIDGVFVGPYDLSQALEIPGQLDDERLLEVGGQVARDVLPQAALGVYVNDAAAAEAWLELGASFYAQATDGQLLLRAVRAAREGWHGAGVDMNVQPQFVRFDDVRSFELAEGVTGRPLFGDGAMLNLIEFAPGSVVPLHSHPHEQLGIVLRGMQALVVDGEAHELGPHEGYVLPGGVEHSAYCGPAGATVLDIFRPVREDYRDRWESSAP